MPTPLVTPIEPPPSRWTMPTDGPIDDSDIVAVGADLEPGTLLAAYRAGLFPMPFDRRRIAWFSPDPRAVIPLDGLPRHPVAASQHAPLRGPMDTEFREVMERAATRADRGRGSTATSSTPTPGCTSWAGRTRSRSTRSGRSDELRRAASYGVRDRRVLRRRVDVPPRDRRLEGRARAPRRLAPRDRRDAARRAVDDPAPGVAGRGRPAASRYLERLAAAVGPS